MKKETIEKMKKLIEEKKKQSTQQGYVADLPNKKGRAGSKGFKSIKRGGAINK
ncbi:MAG: hypothetical protein SCK57_06435 [Bacillota bacterium]|nr:hypothetical protein [Bacillota bacterium]MDW7677282.1 hypothetical protein [Bacillota bacterium]